ncbi:class I SAM-dependent methyltransferase [Belnapia sp. T6]|uniref:Class I SAM-dependent methyltransferase n=1 Tax=Belnapia mucosa TaxID=2804532 RepID=A0ABS1V617_9PROT|nr:class I SAM-dependent methyltransferase [Belnapia mucosa]MBL6457136.1 class I SAM-dependent methyltransferase [Belnapia mucosa]
MKFSGFQRLGVWSRDLAVRVCGEACGSVRLGSRNRQAIYFLVMAFRPKKILEIGTHVGASTISMAAALKRLGEGSSITTVDIFDVNDRANGPWRKIGLDGSPSDFAGSLNFHDRVNFVTAPAQDFMRSTDQSFDFIFLDGSHKSHDVYQEVSAALNLLNPGGTILLHDYFPAGESLCPDKEILQGPFRAMRRIHEENRAIGILPLGALPWATKQGTNATTLALVLKDY